MRNQSFRVCHQPAIGIICVDKEKIYANDEETADDKSCYGNVIGTDRWAVARMSHCPELFTIQFYESRVSFYGSDRPC